MSIDIKDPLRGMNVDPKSGLHRAEHQSPEKSVKPEPAKSTPTGVIYTCPMHPQIRQVGPGNCPICGMALEPVLADAEAGPNPELVDMTRRFWIGLVLAV